MLDKAPSQASPSVLIIDDDEFSQEILGEALRTLGITEIHAAGDGRVAFRMLAALPKPPEFLICDVFMPDMDGIEFLAQLAKQGFGGGIIIVSGVDANMLYMSQLIAGANGLNVLATFVKPVQLEPLAKALGLTPPA